MRASKQASAQGKTRRGVVQNVAVADLSAHYPTRDDHGKPVKLMTILSSLGFVLINLLLYDSRHSYSTILFLTLVASGGCVACPSRSQFLNSCPAATILLADLCLGAAESVRSTRFSGVSHSITKPYYTDNRLHILCSSSQASVLYCTVKSINKRNSQNQNKPNHHTILILQIPLEWRTPGTKRFRNGTFCLRGLDQIPVSNCYDTMPHHLHLLLSDIPAP